MRYYLPLFQRSIFIAFSFFVFVVCAEEMLELSDKVQVEELFEQADASGPWRGKEKPANTWRAPPEQQKHKKRIEWGYDSSYDMLESERSIKKLKQIDFMSPELERNGPKPATLFRLHF